MAEKALDRILSAWLWEYALEFGFPREVPLGAPSGALPAHQGFWDGMEHVDPAKEAKAQEIRLSNHTTTLAHEYARQGRDWAEALRQRARETALIRELGLDAPPPASPGPVPATEEEA